MFVWQSYLVWWWWHDDYQDRTCSDSCRREDSHVSVNSGNMIITIWVFSVSRQISLIGVWSYVRTSESHLYVTLTCFMATVSVIIMYRTSCYVLGFCTAARSMRSANSGKHSTHLRPLCAHDTKINHWVIAMPGQAKPPLPLFSRSHVWGLFGIA